MSPDDCICDEVICTRCDGEGCNVCGWSGAPACPVHNLDGAQ